MKFCPNCGTKIDDQKAGCPNCGFKPFNYIMEAKMSDINLDGEKPKDTKVEAKKTESEKEPILTSHAVKGRYEKYDYYENRSYDTYNYNSYDYVNAESDVDAEVEPSLAAKILLILMVILANIVGAVVGIIVGGVFISKNGKGYKSYGKKLVITSSVFLILDILLWWLIFIAFRKML